MSPKPGDERSDEHSALLLSPKRRMDDEAMDMDAALNPAKNYPRKRVAVAVSCVHPCRLRCRKRKDTVLIIGPSARYVDCARRNATRRDRAVSAPKLVSNVCIVKREHRIQSKCLYHLSLGCCINQDGCEIVNIVHPAGLNSFRDGQNYTYHSRD